jgi:hypothetical protein
MSYECELENGQHLELENEGDQTCISFSSRGDAQTQRQGRGFTTGRWTGNPVVRRSGANYFIQLQTGEGLRFLKVQGNQATLLDDEPELADAEDVELKPFSAPPRMKPMEPMKPMAPMKPMRPMN